MSSKSRIDFEASAHQGRLGPQLLSRQIEPIAPNSTTDGFAHLAGEPRSDPILNALPAAVMTTDAAGRITYFNEAAATLWGRIPELGSSEFCGSLRLFWPDGRPMAHHECPMAVALRENRPVSGIAVIAERPDGSRVHFMPHPTLLRDAQGAVVGAVNMLVDITERVLAERGATQATPAILQDPLTEVAEHARAEEEVKQFASIVQFSADAIISVDRNGIITSWNTSAERLYGYTAQEIVGKSTKILIPPDRSAEESAILKRISDGERLEHYETVRRCKDGSLVDISLTVSPVRNADGEIIGASKIARDIAKRRQTQENQALLISEMNHRIKNTLATVQAIASQTLKGATRDELASFAARLKTLAVAHDLVTAESWTRASLRDVVGRALAAFQDTHGDRIVLVGPDISVDAQQSMLLTLAFHELATNAVKYGALSNGHGRVHVTWAVAETRPEIVRLHWGEVGGPPVVGPRRKGFGSRLIEQIVGAQAGTARLDFEPQGLVCSFELSIDHC